jgi:hypothetical protein
VHVGWCVGLMVETDQTMQPDVLFICQAGRSGNLVKQPVPRCHLVQNIWYCISAKSNKSDPEFLPSPTSVTQAEVTLFVPFHVLFCTTIFADSCIPFCYYISRTSTLSSAINYQLKGSIAYHISFRLLTEDDVWQQLLRKKYVGSKEIPGLFGNRVTRISRLTLWQ